MAKIPGKVTCSVCKSEIRVLYDGKREIVHCPKCKRANALDVLSFKPTFSVNRNPFK